MSATTKEIKILKKFEGKPKETDFQVTDTETPKETDLKENQLLISALYISVDPYLRFRLAPNVPCVGPVVAKVVHSKSKDFVAGFLLFFLWSHFKTNKQTKGNKKNRGQSVRIFSMENITNC